MSVRLNDLLDKPTRLTSAEAWELRNAVYDELLKVSPQGRSIQSILQLLIEPEKPFLMGRLHDNPLYKRLYTILVSMIKNETIQVHQHRKDCYYFIENHDENISR